MTTKRPKVKHLYRFYCSWRATAFIALVEGVDEVDAYERCLKRKDVRGALDVIYLGERE